ncbi:HNH endonuclease signature motif containing protein [Amycolatopsis kentuckyensis]|uniref:HNH endonuclease signature motif containing protein n=1 Tax=Amycolatopsis kentuckyensis TaxID=218823 RepID=UPI000A3B9EAB|nr:HNH endonuclease signature motif containing protein [Amycolatopsis kentuckyensis]
MKPGGPLKRTKPLRRGGPLAQRRKRRPDTRTPEWTESKGRKVVNARSDCCEACGAPGPLEWHHRKLRARGGPWAPSNGLRLCIPHHREVTDPQPEHYTNGWVVNSWDDPAEIPVLHWRLGMVRLDDDGDYHFHREPAETFDTAQEAS